MLTSRADLAHLCSCVQNQYLENLTFQRWRFLVGEGQGSLFFEIFGWYLQYRPGLIPIVHSRCLCTTLCIMLWGGGEAFHVCVCVQQKYREICCYSSCVLCCHRQHSRSGQCTKVLNNGFHNTTRAPVIISLIIKYQYSQQFMWKGYLFSTKVTESAVKVRVTRLLCTWLER